MQENSVPVSIFGSRRYLLMKSFDVCKSHPKIMSNILASVIFFERRYAHIQAYAAVSEQQNCSNSMRKLVRDLKKGPLDCARSALHTEYNFILALYK